MGEVYRATDTKLGRDVAVKIIPEVFARDADRMARFTREAQVLASLNHPHIAAIYGVEDRALIMELVEGPTLAERISQAPIPLPEALPIARQIAEALEYAHEKGFIHRDLKPANVKLTADGQAKVLDFGLAKALSNETPAGDPAASPTLTMRATMTGVILGTAAYMSPEQARGAAADRRADIWSFGVLFFEMLTGRHLFGGETISDTLASVLKTDPDWSRLPSDTPPAIRRLLRRCLERDRKRRLPDIADARLEIDEALAGSPESPAPLAAPAPRAAFRWWYAPIALVALVGLAVAVVHFRETPPQPATVRFQIPAPEKANFADQGMALSPDGRKLAFIAIAASGQPMLWIRPLDSLVSQAMPGTEGAGMLPFWSPDSRFVGFCVQGKLKKVEVSGGPPQTLCEGPALILGGSWNRDGVIIFSTSVGGILRVPQAGGVPTQFTKIDAAKGEAAHMRPWFLPDGEHFLYITRTTRQVDAAIYLGTLDGSQPKRLVSSFQAGAYAPPIAGSRHGHLLFLRESTLMAQPLDTRRFEPTGDPFPVAEHVGSRLALGFFTVSANGVLAYRAGASGGFSQLVWFDRSGKSLGALGPPAVYNGGLALSPDGKRVAVDETDATGNRDVWIVDVARGVPTRFTFEAAQDFNPVWSPDGSRLVFASDRAASINAFDAYQKDSNGSGNEHLLSKDAMPLSWSPDGRQLLYYRLVSNAKSDLWVLPLTGATPADHKPAPYFQTPFNELQGQFSPDGRWVAYVSDESGAFHVYVQSFPIGAGKFQVSTGAGGTQPRWRRDGKEIFYMAFDGKLMAVDVKTAPSFEAGAPKPLFDPAMWGGTQNPIFFRYDVSPDGRRFLVNSIFASTQTSAAPNPITVVVNWLKP